MPSRKGSPNKQKQALIALLQTKYPDYQPVMEMAAGAMELSRLAREAKDDTDLWKEMIAAHDRVAQYVVPKMKAVELSTQEDQQIIVRVFSKDFVDDLENKADSENSGY